MSSVPNSLYNRMPEQTQPPSNDLVRDVSNSSQRSSKLLNFGKAMDDFRNMFPHIDPDVIETVLRANEGVVQVTIDQLLVLSEETTAESDGGTFTSTVSQPSVEVDDNKPRLPGYSESMATSLSEEPPPAYSEIDSGSTGQQNKGNSFQRSSESNSRQSQGSRSSLTGGWRAAMVGKLPDDFLRLSVGNASPTPRSPSPRLSEQRGASSTDRNCYSDDQVEQFLEDEKLAMFLQNEEFIRELRRNPDFIMSLEEDHRQFVQNEADPGRAGGTANERPSPPPHGGARPKVTASQEDVIFRHKLKHMGKTTRRKFGKLAKRFSRKKGTRPPIHGESTANLLEDEIGNERFQGIDSMTPVTEDDDDHDTRVGSPDSNKSPRGEENKMTGRRLPPVPTSRSPTNDEPIVFYSEDNEFAYKTEQ